MNGVATRTSPIEGLGVFATREFHAGDVILVIDTTRVVDADHPLRPEAGEQEDHCTYLEDGRVVLVGPPGRHLNHCCDPNAYLHMEGADLRVIARRPVAQGEEITLDYVINTHGGSRWTCSCGADRCRGLLESSFFDLPVALQKEYAGLLASWFVERHAEKVRALTGPLP